MWPSASHFNLFGVIPRILPKIPLVSFGDRMNAVNLDGHDEIVRGGGDKLPSQGILPACLKIIRCEYHDMGNPPDAPVDKVVVYAGDHISGGGIFAIHFFDDNHISAITGFKNLPAREKTPVPVTGYKQEIVFKTALGKVLFEERFEVISLNG